MIELFDFIAENKRNLLSNWALSEEIFVWMILDKGSMESSYLSKGLLANAAITFRLFFRTIYNLKRRYRITSNKRPIFRRGVYTEGAFI